MKVLFRCYNFFMKRKRINLLSIKKKQLLCPVCKKHYFSELNAYEICPICGWEDDKLQRKDPDMKGGANKLSLNEAIKEYHEKTK